MRVLLYAVVLVLASSAAPLRADPQAWGKSVNGLRISISLAQTDHPDSRVPGFRVDFRNRSDRDYGLHLGLMAGIGKYPRALFLIITDAQGKSRRFDLIKPAGILGHINPFVVRLPVRGTYSVPVNLDDYWVVLSKEPNYKLTPGTYDIQARFIGIDDVAESGPGALPLWTGTVVSNHLRFEITQQQ